MGSSRTELLQQLRDLGVETVTARYDGSGDNGQIEAPEFGSVEVPGSLVTSVEDLFFDILENHYRGWEDNEGGFGEFVWDMTSDTINLVHNSRFESYETEKRNL